MSKPVLFYPDFLETFKELPKELGYDYVLACLEYANGNETPEITDFTVRVLFKQFKAQYQRELAQEAERSAKARASVNARWQKKKANTDYTNECERIQTNTNECERINRNTNYTLQNSTVQNGTERNGIDKEDNKLSFVDATGDDGSDLPVSDPEPNPNPEPEVKCKRNAKMPDPPYEVILELYKEILPELSQPSVLNAQRKGAINARWRELNSIAKTAEERVACFRKVFENAKSNDWNFGNNERGWKASFDYFMQPKAFNQYLDWQAQPSGASNMSSTQKPWQVSGDAMPTSYEQYQQWRAEGWRPTVYQNDALQASGVIPSDGSYNKQNTRRA